MCLREKKKKGGRMCRVWTHFDVGEKSLVALLHLLILTLQ